MSKNRKRRIESDNNPAANITSSTRSSTSNRADQFNPDYTYVIKDLRTIGILAAIFITILVVLSLII